MADPDSHYGFPDDTAGDDEQPIISVSFAQPCSTRAFVSSPRLTAMVPP